ncbi:ABC transporter ATP-binding protein [Psychromarinibacter sp. C21-152]|uniref:ABC transporter ATP-binding protein n=1 Tax=Psychromarinibacter sediminicola TaxID=3033385 RepID=A0AAE3T7F8_9RHOB|nr:ABC transporter ATP-binding protein [Psychromarinibacter sediminicola]MDF0599618.1 ABC transporter ATP-binding protein [Psychromarinibacter sediminicola]
MTTGVSLKNVRKSFGSVDVIHDVSIDIPKGDFAVFVGPSGCGKSTLLRMIAGLEDTSGGRIEIDGKDVTEEEPADRGVAMVFQNYALYPHLTVFDNMAFSLRLAGAKKDVIREKVAEAARILQLTDHLAKRPANLSGGQRQRVAIGRAIVRQPSVFLFDEPLSNLDAELRVQMRLELARLHRELGATMIYVTHDQVEAMTLANDIFVLRDGWVQQAGTPLTLYDDPDNRFVGGFIGSPAMNFFEAEVTGGGDGVMQARTRIGQHTFTARHTGAAPEGRTVTLGIRPEHIALAEDGLRAKVDMVEQLGGVSYLHVKLEDGSNVVVERHGLREALEGHTVGLTAEPDDILVFDPEGRRLR